MAIRIALTQYCFAIANSRDRHLMATLDQVSVVSQQAGRLVQILNESLHIANDSKSIKTRISRLRLAKDKLAEVQTLAQQYPFLSLESLPEVMKCIEELDREIDAQIRSNTSKPRLQQITTAPGYSAAMEGKRLRDLSFAVIDLDHGPFGEIRCQDRRDRDRARGTRQGPKDHSRHFG